MIDNNLYKFKIRYLGLIFITILLLTSFAVEWFCGYKYSDQNLDLVDIPPVVKIIKLTPDYGVYIHKDLYPVLFTRNGETIGLLKKIKSENKVDVYIFDDKQLVFDYQNIPDFKNIDYKKIKIIYNNKVLNQSDENEKVLWNKSNIFGTDQLGRDLFIRVFQGIKISLIIGLTAGVVNLLIGVLYGGLAGYVGGKLDTLMLSVLNIISLLPPILIVILLSLFIPQSIWSVIITIGSVYWVGMARQVRVQVMALKQREFVLAEIVMGTPRYKIIFKHIMPNIKETIMTVLIVNIQNAIFTESFLSFLGLGLPAPIASLGTLVNDAMSNFRASPYQLIIPSLAILLILICLDKMFDNRYS